jgi:hypothetical protein
MSKHRSTEFYRKNGFRIPYSKVEVDDGTDISSGRFNPRMKIVQNQPASGNLWNTADQCVTAMLRALEILGSNIRQMTSSPEIFLCFSQSPQANSRKVR